MSRPPHPYLEWHPAPSVGYELTLHGFTYPLGRTVPRSDGTWRTVALAPGRQRQGTTAGSIEQARKWLTAWATPIAWRHRPTTPTNIPQWSKPEYEMPYAEPRRNSKAPGAGSG